MTENPFYHVVLSDLEDTLFSLSKSRQILYLKNVLFNVEQLRDTKLYVSVADITSEKNDLAKLLNKIKVLTKEVEDTKKLSYPLVVQEFISLLTKEVDKYKAESNSIRQSGLVVLSELRKLKVTEQQLVNKIRESQSILDRHQIDVFKAQYQLVKEPFIPDLLPKNILKKPPKKIRRELINYRREQDKKKQIWLQQKTGEIEKYKLKVSEAKHNLYTLRIQLYPVTSRIEELEHRYNIIKMQITEYRRLTRNLQARIRRLKAKQVVPLLFELTKTKLLKQILKSTIKRKVKSTLQRVQLNFYVIIKGNNNYQYDRRSKDGEKKRVTIKYPKGKFQVLINCDCFIEPDTDVILFDIDPLNSLYPLMSDTALRIINDNFNTSFTSKTDTKSVGKFVKDLTVGVTNADLGTYDLGTPPELVSFARSTNDVEGSGNQRDSRFSVLNTKDWSSQLNSPLMSQPDYNRFISGMKDYVTELKRLGKYRTGLEEY